MSEAVVTDTEGATTYGTENYLDISSAKRYYYPSESSDMGLRRTRAGIAIIPWHTTASWTTVLAESRSTESGPTHGRATEYWSETDGTDVEASETPDSSRPGEGETSVSTS